ncbi:unnamed protein product [Prorocentrum cordatum]|uniref:Uncharacterized protein n=1 Tax=Prorocentrum cordatum TaxID=2364126 RepID=A0ABN9PUG8_9DINO|nr:unnamed protein product [Polarella glacialis]
MKSLLKCLRPSVPGSVPVPSASGPQSSGEEGPAAGGHPGCASGEEQSLEFVPGRGIAYAREGVGEDDLQVAEDLQLREAPHSLRTGGRAAAARPGQPGCAVARPEAGREPHRRERGREAIAESLGRAAASRPAAPAAGAPAAAAGGGPEGAPWTCTFCETRNSGAGSASGSPPPGSGREAGGGRPRGRCRGGCASTAHCAASSALVKSRGVFAVAMCHAAAGGEPVASVAMWRAAPR